MQKNLTLIRDSARLHKHALIFLLFWYVALFPGRIGYDGTLANNLMREGKSTDIWTGQYFLITKILTFSGKEIWLVALFQLAILAFALKVFCDTFIEDRKRSRMAWTVLCATPLIGVFGVTVAHDAYLCAGVIIAIADLATHDRDTLHDSRLSRIAGPLTTFLLSMNFLGYPILAFYILVKLLRRKFKFVIEILVFFLAFTSAASMIINHEITPPRYLFPLAADLKCVAQEPAAKLDFKDWAFLQTLATKDYLLNPVACNSTDSTAILLDSVLSGKVSQSDFIKSFLRIALKNPATVITSHVIKAEEILPPPFFPHVKSSINFNAGEPIGMKTDSSLINGSDFLHISIDDRSIKKWKYNKLFEIIALFATYLFNISSNLWGWGGLWLMISLFFIGRLKFPRGQFFILSTPFILLLISLALAGPIAAPRYAFSVIIAGIALTVGNLNPIKI